MSQPDYEAIFEQLHAVHRSLRSTNEELHRRCRELEAQFDAPPFGLYNRVVNQGLLGQGRAYAHKLRRALRTCRRVVGLGSAADDIDGIG
jgi:hypothetical protein